MTEPPDEGINPRVSVVIPTAGHRSLLSRAVSTALTGMRAGEVEVIVVPNGPNSSCVEMMRGYDDNPDVIVSPIPMADANAARNHGLSLARGRYVRFLDDDDLLYPEGARSQYAIMDDSRADVCSGAFDAMDDKGSVFQTVCQAPTDDLISALFSRHGMWQPTAHVYRREAIQYLRWKESLAYCQDFAWLLDVALENERRWVRCEYTVGAWHRHLSPRISLDASDEARRRMLVELTLPAVLKLEADGRMTEERRKAVATFLWKGVHDSLCYRPLYWTKVARKAQEIAPGSHPDIPLYAHHSSWRLDPLLWEWLMLPKRRMNRWLHSRARSDGRLGHG